MKPKFNYTIERIKLVTLIYLTTLLFRNIFLKLIYRKAYRQTKQEYIVIVVSYNKYSKYINNLR